MMGVISAGYMINMTGRQSQAETPPMVMGQVLPSPVKTVAPALESLPLKKSTPSYNVLSGEIKIDMNGNVGFSIDKAKVAVILGEGDEMVIPLIIKNYTKDNIKIKISPRIPDFITEGYSQVGESAVSIMPKLTEMVIPAMESYRQEITITWDEVCSTDKVEGWVSVLEMRDSGMARELILRLLISQ